MTKGSCFAVGGEKKGEKEAGRGKEKNEGIDDFLPTSHTDFMILSAWNPSYK